MKDKIKEIALKVWAAIKSAPAVFAYGVALGYVLNFII